MNLDQIRDDAGHLPSYAWPGGYPLIYFSRDGLTLCPACANREDCGDEPIAYDVYWEGPPIACDDCGRQVQSAYGDPEQE